MTTVKARRELWLNPRERGGRGIDLRQVQVDTPAGCHDSGFQVDEGVASQQDGFPVHGTNSVRFPGGMVSLTGTRGIDFEC